MLVVDGIIYSLQRGGGITVYFNEILRRMETDLADGFQLLVYAGSAANQDYLPVSTNIRSIRVAERYRHCPVPGQASLFHSSYYRLPDRRVPVVTTVHDFIYERFGSGPRRWLHSWQKFAAIRASQAVICISESTRRDLRQFLPDVQPERLHVVHNGVSSAFYPLAPEAVAEAAGRPYVLFVGARSGYKNFARLVQAMAELSDLDLVSVGGGGLTPQELELVHRLLGGRFVHHLGVSNAHLNQLYNGAFCLAYPSAYEGFGIPVLEAMRAGCP
jgi:mannosyltransferase